MDWMFAVLKELAKEHEDRFFASAGKEIKDLFGNSKYLYIFDVVFEKYYRKETMGRWYDPCHVAYSTLFAVRLVKCGEASPSIVPAIIMHDLGYHSSLVDKANWSSPNSRIIHMQEGAALAAGILKLEGGFNNPYEIEKIVGMVASHDNGYLGISTSDKDRLALRDADRIWVMHPLSFYKDWISKKAKGENLSLLDLLRSRASSFYGPGELAPCGKLIIPDKEDAIQSPPFSNLAKEWRDKQFESRLREIQQDAAGSPEKFRIWLQVEIETELSLGLG